MAKSKKNDGQNIMRDFMTIKLGEGQEAILFKLLDEPIEKNAVGLVECALFSGRTLVLVVDTRIEDEREYEYACFVPTKKKDVGSVYMTDDTFQGLKRQSAMETMIVLHEIGHFYHMHQPLGSKEATFEKRMLPVTEGKVYSDESEADEFAAKYIGYQAAAEALSQMNRKSIEQYSNGEYNPEEVALSIKEVELRIQILQNKAT